MKSKFIITIGAVLTIAVGSVGVLQHMLFRAEQFRLIDSRIEATASLLISSNLSRADLKDFDQVEQIIAEVVGGEKFNQFIVIYNRDGREIYRSLNAEVLPDVLPKAEKWQTIGASGHVIRILTLPLSISREGKLELSSTDGGSRILQTGLILDEDLVRLRELSTNILVYSLVIIAMILVATMWLSKTLLSPLKNLALYLRYIGSRLDWTPELGVPEVAPPELPDSNDEFGLLVAETQRLRDLLGRGLKNTQAWTAQMAHEMKTPLTVLQNSLERAQGELSHERRDQHLRDAGAEVQHLNALINSFLEWSAAENFSQVSEDVQAVRLDLVVRDLVGKFSRQTPGRIRFENQSHGPSAFRIFAKQGFVQQAISNLITNALKYSSQEVIVRLLDQGVEIIDRGPGLPAHVLEHLGEPFNHGYRDRRGFGLGLAWVTTICRKYRWQMSFARVADDALGELTCARILFPRDE